MAARLSIRCNRARSMTAAGSGATAAAAMCAATSAVMVLVVIDPPANLFRRLFVDCRQLTIQRELGKKGPRKRSMPAPPCGGRARSEEHTSELQSLMRISYAVFCLKKKTKRKEKK